MTGIKETQILKRISVRWLPDPAYEDSVTISLNVGGWYMDLRVATADGSLQWSRAGERKTLRQEPLTFQWTRSINSFGITDADEAAFEDLPNGDSLETGWFKKDGHMTAYEEIWRDVTEDGDFGDSNTSASSCAWILQSTDGRAFLGKIGHTFMGMRQGEDGSFAVRSEVYKPSRATWETAFESGQVQETPRAVEALRIESRLESESLMAKGEKIQVSSREYVIQGLYIPE